MTSFILQPIGVRAAAFAAEYGARTLITDEYRSSAVGDSVTMLKTTYRPSAPLPPGWTEHTAPSGHKYYYNASTKQSTYTRPQSAQATEQEELQIDYNATAPDASLHATAQALDEFYRHSDPRKRGHGGDRPKSKKPIPGAEPWVLVITKFGRRFVHNTETKQSLWKFPQDIMMAVIDLDRAEWERRQREKEQTVAEEAQREADERDPESARGREALKLANEMQRGGDDEGYNVALFRSLLDDFGISPYTTFDKITEDLNLVEDRRYLALSNMSARRDVFIDWSKERVLAINATRAAAEASDNNDPTISYLAFLHQHATPKLYWPEFKRKHRKEAAMKSYELSDKDRERLYRELTGKLKLGEGERRKEVLALLNQHLGSSSKKDSRVIPHTIRRDVRYYILDVRKRDEIVGGFLDML
ncbi:hypothetical protein DV736_g3588, partial [Chaetothyriales sp. CBS 134916]